MKHNYQTNKYNINNRSALTLRLSLQLRSQSERLAVIRFLLREVIHPFPTKEQGGLLFYFID